MKPVTSKFTPKTFKKLTGLCLKSGFAMLVWGQGLLSPGLAAEQLKVRFGPFEQSVAIADLEDFVKTGELSPALKPYTAVLTPDIRQTLGTRLPLNSPGALTSMTAQSTASEQSVLQLLETIVQDTTSQQLQVALNSAEQQAEGLSLLTLLKVFPEKTVAIDANATLAAASQFTGNALEQQLLAPELDSKPALAGDSFKSTLDPTVSGPEAVQVTQLSFDDSQRQRTIPVDVYWSRKTQGPLVVISHGLGGDRQILASLAHHLASHGLTVVALEHPGSNAAWLHTQGTSSRSPLLSPQEFVERPQDVSFLLDQLTTLNHQVGPLQGKLKTAQVSVIGHSLGGYTGLALAGGRLDLNGLGAGCQVQPTPESARLDCHGVKIKLRPEAIALPQGQLTVRDPRVAQVMALNPFVGNLFGETGLTHVDTSTFVFSGTEDAVTPALSHQLRPFSQLPESKYLLTAIGGTHFSVCDRGCASAQTPADQVQIEPHTAPLRKLLRGISLAFIHQLTPEATTYSPFLTPAYAQALSTEELPLRLNSKLSASLVQLLN